jgi:hypothetical protein
LRRCVGMLLLKTKEPFGAAPHRAITERLRCVNKRPRMRGGIEMAEEARPLLRCAASMNRRGEGRKNAALH